MKRSQVNQIIRDFEALLDKHRFELPPFLKFTPEEWKTKGHEYDEIRDNALGWDITDFGMGEYDKMGLALITLRNGNVNNPKYTKTYAEKICYVKEGQSCPRHFHWKKMEDIINRGGGTIDFRLWVANEDGTVSDSDVTIFMDGRRYTVPAGQEISLRPGESLSLYPYYYHEYIIREGSALVGEVSMCNDDHEDNYFFLPIGRFPAIEEDEPPYRLLCSEYPPAAN